MREPALRVVLPWVLEAQRNAPGGVYRPSAQIPHVLHGSIALCRDLGLDPRCVAGGGRHLVEENFRHLIAVAGGYGAAHLLRHPRRGLEGRHPFLGVLEPARPPVTAGDGPRNLCTRHEPASQQHLAERVQLLTGVRGHHDDCHLCAQPPVTPPGEAGRLCGFSDIPVIVGWPSRQKQRTLHRYTGDPPRCQPHHKRQPPPSHHHLPAGYRKRHMPVPGRSWPPSCSEPS